MTVDPSMVGSLAMVLGLVVCVGILFTMRDQNFGPAQVTVCSVRCPIRQQVAVVEFVERTSTGMRMRGVESCSIRGSDDRCREQCRSFTRVLGVLRTYEASVARTSRRWRRLGGLDSLARS